MEVVGVLNVDQIAEIRLRSKRGESIRKIAKECQISRNTVRKVLRSGSTEETRKKGEWSKTKLTDFKELLEKLLQERADEESPKRKKSLLSMYQILREEGFTGSYDTVRRFAKNWSEEQKSGLNNAFVPQYFAPGEAFQFDWSEERVKINGEIKKIYLAHIILCYSRMIFLKIYPRMSLEMVLDSHIAAHNFFDGLPKRGIYDNLKTVVSNILQGNERIYNTKFVRLASHYLFEINACTPASGWEKGQVERNVEVIRDKYFRDNKNYKTIDELNDFLVLNILQYVKTKNHPEFNDKTIFSVFEEEKKYLCKQDLEFDGYIEEERKAMKNCLVQFDHNQYSVPCEYANKHVTLRIYSNKIKVEFNGTIIAEHKRSFDKNKYILAPEHYLPLIKRKPGSLRNGRPFLNWNLPENIKKIWEVLISEPCGDRKLANILSEIQHYGIDIVDKACKECIEKGVFSDTAIINLIRRSDDKPDSEEVVPPASLKISNNPIADLKKYDSLIHKHT